MTQLKGVVLETLLRQEVVEGLGDVRNGFGMRSDESSQLFVNRRGSVHGVQPLWQKDGERRRDVPCIADIVLPLFVRLLKSDIFFKKFHGVRVLLARVVAGRPVFTALQQVDNDFSRFERKLG